MLIFYILAVIVVVLGIMSLRGGFDFAGYVKSELQRPKSNYTPFVSMIAPCRGIESDLADNLAALIRQRFPAYEIIFVTDSSGDPAVRAIQQTIDSVSARDLVAARLVIAGDAVDCGQKVHNLRIAVGEVDPRCEVLVFVDSDARPHDGWLKDLVEPLSNAQVGAATGYRWFVADEGGMAAHLRSVWNASIASALGSRSDKNFCWGGSTAIRRETFDGLGVCEAWRGTVSDDFTITRVLQQAKLPIHFVPTCLIPSAGACGVGELFEFTNRQLKITRNYAPHLWKPVLIGGILFNTVFFGGFVIVVVRAALGLSFAVPLVFLAVIFALGAAKSWVRLKAVKSAMQMPTGSGGGWAHLLLWPLASALFLWNALAAAGSRRIVWRGITYELKSASEAVIIRREGE
jgi:ceramide glucosyltransferase